MTTQSNHEQPKTNLSLEDLGYHAQFERHRKENNLDSFGVGRVISEHREAYIVKAPGVEYDAEIIGNLRFTAESRSDFPAVGDWVAISPYDDDKALIHAVLPRTTIIERQAAGKKGEKQIIATNVDSAFIVQAVDRDFSINRVERYMTICHASGVVPILLLNKIDLIDPHQLEDLIQQIRTRIGSMKVIPTSTISQAGFDVLRANIERGKTYCLLGSSGVGKSSLTNALLGQASMKTNTIGMGTNRGRHVTTHRELFVLPNGGILIDNPGMREVGIADSQTGLDITFDAIREQAQHCKFADCSHITEVGCAVLSAVEEGLISRSSYENFFKIAREQEHFESTIAQRRKKDKTFGKMVKSHVNSKRRNR